MLTFRLKVVEKVDRHWVKCRRVDREGLLPASHITQVENIPKLSDNQRIFISLNDCSADRGGCLSFTKGKYLNHNLQSFLLYLNAF